MQPSKPWATCDAALIPESALSGCVLPPELLAPLPEGALISDAEADALRAYEALIGCRRDYRALVKHVRCQ